MKFIERLEFSSFIDFEVEKVEILKQRQKFLEGSHGLRKGCLGSEMDSKEFQKYQSFITKA